MNNFNSVLLEHATPKDFEFFVRQLDSPLNFSASTSMNALLRRFMISADQKDKEALCSIIDEELRYAGSSDIAFFLRNLCGSHGAIEGTELIADVARKLKVKLEPVASMEDKLASLLQRFFEKSVSEMSLEELEQCLGSSRVSEAKKKEILWQVERSAMSSLPAILIMVLGKVVVKQLLQDLVYLYVVKYATKEAGKIAAREFGKRVSSSYLGPIGLGITIGWSIFDLQGPAFRNTMPAVLYLGVMILRRQCKSNEEGCAA